MIRDILELYQFESAEVFAYVVIAAAVYLFLLIIISAIRRH